MEFLFWFVRGECTDLAVGASLIRHEEVDSPARCPTGGVNSVASSIEAILRAYDDPKHLMVPSAHVKHPLASSRTKTIARAYQRFLGSLCPQPACPILPPERVDHEGHDSHSSVLALGAGALTGSKLPGWREKRREIVGKYCLIREIGLGGMGVVYEAVREGDGPKVALKAIRSSLEEYSSFKELFVQEASVMKGLCHPNIIPVLEAGEDGGTLYYTMPLLDAVTLDDVLEELNRLLSGEDRRLRVTSAAASPSATLVAERMLYDDVRSGYVVRQGFMVRTRNDSDAASAAEIGGACVNISWRSYLRSVATLVIQVAEALEYLHSRRIIHRDISPSNILVDHLGTVFVCDFGIARPDGDESIDHVAIGKPKYSAPEMGSRASDERVDIYGFGMTLYDFLSIVAPHQQSPDGLQWVVLKCIAPDAERRYSRMTEVVQDLRRYLSDGPIDSSQVDRRLKNSIWSSTACLFDLAVRDPAEARSGKVVGSPQSCNVDVNFPRPTRFPRPFRYQRRGPARG